MLRKRENNPTAQYILRKPVLGHTYSLCFTNYAMLCVHGQNSPTPPECFVYTDKTIPLLRSAWSMALRAMTVECERFIYFFIYLCNALMLTEHTLSVLCFLNYYAWHTLITEGIGRFGLSNKDNLFSNYEFILDMDFAQLFLQYATCWLL